MLFSMLDNHDDDNNYNGDLGGGNCSDDYE